MTDSKYIMKKLVMLTAYDYITSRIIDTVGIDYILVGDSLAMTTLGYKDTKSITITEMISHTKAVKRGVKNTLIIADMPINTYFTAKQALINAKKFINAGADMVKIEGYKPEIIKEFVKNKISVVAHLGLLPQTAEKYSVAGRDQHEAEKILSNAINLDKLGIKLLVLECIPSVLAQKISSAIETPTIGIGAGINCDGQVLVLADILGLTDKKLKMSKQYVNVASIIKQAVNTFKKEVEEGKFPGEENSFK